MSVCVGSAWKIIPGTTRDSPPPRCCYADSNVLEEESCICCSRCSNSRQSQRTKKVWKPFLSSSSSLLLLGFLTRSFRKWFSECVFAVRFGVRCTSYARFEQNDLSFHCTIDAKTILWQTMSFLPIFRWRRNRERLHDRATGTEPTNRRCIGILHNSNAFCYKEFKEIVHWQFDSLM
jgi:hypothetical protein